MRKLIAIAGSVALAGAGLAAPALATPGMNPDGEHKYVVCHATSSDTNPYVVVVVDVAAAGVPKIVANHQMHVDEPNKTWNSDGTWMGTPHEEGDSKEDVIETTLVPAGYKLSLEDAFEVCFGEPPEPPE